MVNLQEDIESHVWYSILNAFPNNNWEYPLTTFMHNTTIGSKKSIIVFMHNLVRFLYAEGLSNGIHSRRISEEICRAEQAAKCGIIYEPKIEINDKFKQRLALPIPIKLQWGVCAILEFYRPDLIIEFAKRKILLEADHSVLETAVVEYIVPQHWNISYGGWNSEIAQSIQRTIGNMILLEKRLNINGSDNFIKQKTSPTTGFGYRDSIFSEAQFIHNALKGFPHSSWRYNLYKQLQYEHIKRLCLFFQHCGYRTS